MKRKLHKLIALIVATAMLCALFPMGATAEEVEPQELLTLLGTSRSEVYDNSGAEVLALAFRFRIDAAGLAYGEGRKTMTDNATVTFGGESYHLVRIGAVMANKAAVGNNPNAMVVGNKNVTHIEGRFLYALGKTYGEIVARIVNIPYERINTLIYARPYYVYENADGEEVYVYGNIDSANASGKKVRYSLDTAVVDWTAGSVDATTGEVCASEAELRTDFINNTDLLIRLPETDKGTPTAFVRAHYYSTEGYISYVDVTANWTVLNDLVIPQDTAMVRLTAIDNPEEETVTHPSSVVEDILITANKKMGAIPLTFQKGGLSEETGVETDDPTYNRTGYLAVQDVLVKPENNCKFVVYYYDAEGTFLYCEDMAMAKAKRLLDLTPLEASYVRFQLHQEQVEIEDDEYLEEDEEPLTRTVTDQPEESTIPSYAAYFQAYIYGSTQYEDFSSEADEEEEVPTTTESTTETTLEETTNTSHSDPTASESDSTTATSSTTSTTKKTVSTTKKTTTKKKTTTTKTENLVLTADVPENKGVQNALWRMKQLVDITYTPIKTLPQSYKDYAANVQRKGIPYSSTRIEQAYVPNNVSFHTFMTALQNPKSYLYTVDLGEDYGNINGDTYYGTVCSTTCGYALDIVGDYTTYQWTQIPGMELLKKQDLQQLKLGDTIVGQGHVVMITGIVRDQYGRIVEVEVSESGGIRASAKKSTITALEERFPADQYEYCRYSKISSVTYTASEYVAVGNEKTQTVSYNTSIIPRKGDKANWRTSETIVLDVLKKSTFTDVEIYRWVDDDWALYQTKDIATTIKLTKQKPGVYKARLTNGSKNSKWCYWRVVDAVSEGVHYQSTRQVKVSFSASNAEPLFVQWMNGNTNATVRITQLTEEQKKQGYGIFVPAKGDLKVRVAFKTAYGIIYSELPDIITVQ